MSRASMPKPGYGASEWMTHKIDGIIYVPEASDICAPIERKEDAELLNLKLSLKSLFFGFLE